MASGPQAELVVKCNSSQMTAAKLQAIETLAAQNQIPMRCSSSNHLDIVARSIPEIAAVLDNPVPITHRDGTPKTDDRGRQKTAVNQSALDTEVERVKAQFMHFLHQTGMVSAVQNATGERIPVNMVRQLGR